MSLRSRDSLWFGLSLLMLGAVVAIVGYMRFAAPLAEATGIIKRADLASNYYGAGPRVVSYSYSVDGKEYSGQAAMRYSPRQDSALHVGHQISVFYEISHPLVSYPVAPPSRMWWVSGGIVLAAFGITAIVWGWSH